MQKQPLLHMKMHLLTLEMLMTLIQVLSHCTKQFNASTVLPSSFEERLPLSTGIFTAPVKGVYFFNFVVFNPDEEPTGVRLLKNGNSVVTASDNAPGQDTEDTTSNSVSLILERGDKIYLQLLENRRVYTDSWRRNTFSGHLLFTL